MSYKPPFSITNGMVALVSDISEKIGRVSNFQEFKNRPYLRKNNRIRSIRSSLAIEANSLSLDEVRAVIDGKTVFGPQREIQEVKNAYRAYEELGRFDPCSLTDIKRIHGIMTYLTVDDAGEFREKGEGVFDGDRCIFIAPPAKLVPQLMSDLFQWLSIDYQVHPLIRSSVFHYEFVFIHPFSDGNGRMARLWQAAILSQWHPLFQYMPLENQIHEFQTEYYNAISDSHKAGNSNAFIEFMLDMIDRTLDMVLTQVSAHGAELSRYVRNLMEVMEYGAPYTSQELLDLLHLKSRGTLYKNYLSPAIKMGLVVMGIPDKPTSRNQVYIRPSMM